MTAAYGPTLTVNEVARLTSTGTQTVYEAIRAGTFPFPTYRIGRRVVIPTRPVLDALGLEGEVVIKAA